MTAQARGLDALRQGLNGIPAVPQAGSRLFTTLTDDTLDLRQAADVVAEMPTVAARVLALANSAWSMPPAPITTLRLACERIGLTLLRSVAIGLTVSNCFNSNRCPNFVARRYWARSMFAAELAARLADGLEMPQRPNASTVGCVGLLHNLGLLALAHIQPRATHLALARLHQGTAATLTAALRLEFDFDHLEVGALVVERWRLPSVYWQGIAHQNDSDYAGAHWEVAQTVGQALDICRSVRQASVAVPRTRLETIGVNSAQVSAVQGMAGPLSVRFDALAESMFSPH